MLPIDNLSSLLSQHTLQAHVFFNGSFCGSTRFEEDGEGGHLHLVRSGRVLLHHRQREALEVSGPALVFYPRGLEHQVQVDQEDALLLCARIRFDGGAGDTLALSLPECMTVAPKQVDGMAASLALLHEEAERPGPGQQVLLDRVCAVIVTQLLRHAHRHGHLHTSVVAARVDPGLSRLLDLLHDEPAQAWPLARMAKLANMSRSKFSSHFHATLGLTPADYLGERRMLLAQTLLQKGASVQAVAIRVGYASQSAFSKAFTARRGMSPRAWLKTRNKSPEKVLATADTSPFLHRGEG
ncbi:MULTISPECIES: AraC family transcriptional regulator [unclassified Janthinobacterium]|uniref:helix-turn-helix transcriptional regulator n=1 Tax=unclassified Janthinobacterium TaxID=2610881 RepID=UPI0016125C4A|nr:MULTISPECIES: AraC family transcriptional regulator [unclassified Janthinobacterium]MBB5606543.1 AraC-like DNA-binding protein [Janthinobacterium sp. S3T4]MBB5611585.1 AraC-like DNA-binding protein [Janthinobacterium sp. S3M3]